MTLNEFNNLGQQFLNVIQPIVRPKALHAIHKYLAQHADIYVVTASIENWVKPWALSVGITNTIATQVEINEHGLLTGRFLTKNCYGIEKVNRLLQFEPRRENYTLHAFGDSRGDRELLALADLKHYKYF
jgi:HAD superfamily phosphoserine phosphatase-like hydrolase